MFAARISFDKLSRSCWIYRWFHWQTSWQVRWGNREPEEGQENSSRGKWMHECMSVRFILHLHIYRCWAACLLKAGSAHLNRHTCTCCTEQKALTNLCIQSVLQKYSTHQSIIELNRETLGYGVMGKRTKLHTWHLFSWYEPPWNSRGFPPAD